MSDVEMPERRQGHGGARPGTGRPRLAEDEPTVRRMVRLPRSLDAKALRLGHGNVSEGVRRALAAYSEREE